MTPLIFCQISISQNWPNKENHWAYSSPHHQVSRNNGGVLRDGFQEGASKYQNTAVRCCELLMHWNEACKQIETFNDVSECSSLFCSMNMIFSQFSFRSYFIEILRFWTISGLFFKYVRTYLSRSWESVTTRTEGACARELSTIKWCSFLFRKCEVSKFLWPFRFLNPQVKTMDNNNGLFYQ